MVLSFDISTGAGLGARECSGLDGGLAGFGGGLIADKRLLISTRSVLAILIQLSTRLITCKNLQGYKVEW